MSVTVAGKMTSLKKVTSGVPQGSVLGLVLFLIYVNWKAFSDDFKLYLSFPRGTCVPILQRMMQLQSDLAECVQLQDHGI